jgi:ParB family chromosome partitioning protein
VLKEYGFKPHDEPQELTVEEIIKTSHDLKELKDICLAEPQFKGIRGKIASYKEIEVLREDMLWCLMPKSVPEILHDKLEAEPIKTTVEEVAEKHSIIIDDPIKEKNEISIEKVIQKDPFQSLFVINPITLASIEESIKKNGYDTAFPIILWKGVLIDGYTRLKAAQLASLEWIPFEEKDFKDEQEAIEYSIHNQRDRRNISEAELLKCISLLDKPMTKKEAGKKGGGTKVAKEEKIEATHKTTAKILGVSESKITDARVVLKDEKATEEVKSGKKTISQAAKEIKEKKPKKEKDSTMSLYINCIDGSSEYLYPLSTGDIQTIIKMLKTPFKGLITMEIFEGHI